MPTLRRLLVALAILTGPALPGSAMTGSAGPHGPVVLPDHGALWGAHIELDPHNGLERRQAWTAFESLVGRTLAIDREYYFWDDEWPTADDEWSRDRGHTLFFSWKANIRDSLECVSWGEIAAGLHDAELDAQAAKLVAFGAPVFFAFHHEPKNTHGGARCGEPQDYVAAWTHIRDRFTADGVTNATYTWTMAASAFASSFAEDYYPGDEVADVIAADGFNWFGCDYHQGDWREAEAIFGDFHDFGVAHGKPMAVAEYGTGEDPDVPGRKAQWFANFAAQMKAWPDVKAVSYYNVGTGSCDRYVDTSASSLDAFSAMGADPYFTPPMTRTPVSVADFTFDPATVSVGPGGLVEWTFGGPSDHTVSDATGLALFDSGPRGPGEAFSYPFLAAGRYRYRCTIHPTMWGTVRVPMAAEPPSGNEQTTFTLTWGAEWAPAGFAFQVHIQRPGEPTWSAFAETGDNRMEFVPDGGVGTYRFRARFVDQATGEVTGWSSPVSISVS